MKKKIFSIDSYFFLYYGLVFVAAMIYYVSVANGFWWSMVGVLKALAWPVFIVYDIVRHFVK